MAAGVHLAGPGNRESCPHPRRGAAAHPATVSKPTPENAATMPGIRHKTRHCDQRPNVTEAFRTVLPPSDGHHVHLLKLENFVRPPARHKEVSASQHTSPHATETTRSKCHERPNTRSTPRCPVHGQEVGRTRHCRHPGCPRRGTHLRDPRGKLPRRPGRAAPLPRSKPSFAATKAAPPTWPRPTARCTSGPASPWSPAARVPPTRTWACTPPGRIRPRWCSLWA